MRLQSAKVISKTTVGSRLSLVAPERFLQQPTCPHPYHLARLLQKRLFASFEVVISRLCVYPGGRLSSTVGIVRGHIDRMPFRSWTH